MNRSVASQRKITALAGWRRAVLLFALLAFTVQGYLVQTHIHGLPETVAAMESGKAFVSSPAQPGKSPVDDDSVNCPLCQEFAHAGIYLLPADIAALPPAIAVAIVETVIAPLHTAKSASHIWLGRAPPQA